MDDLSAVDPKPLTTDPGPVQDSAEVRSADDVANELRRAFTTGELTAYFQPQYDLANGQVVAVEALCRWQHPEQGLLMPAGFIEIAERYGLIADLGRYMLEESGRQVADWHRRGVDVGVAINVSPTELSPEFAQTALRRFQELEVPPSAVTVEVTESPAFLYSDDEFATLNALIAGGAGVSIDDFGAGSTSLELVRRLPLTEVKIDKSLVHDTSDGVDALVRDCLAIAEERGVRVVAEGIETREHLERAVRWGCDRAQGYYFAPPLPVAEVEPLLLTVA